MKTIKVEYQTTQREGSYFADVPIDEKCFIDELNLQIEEYLISHFDGVTEFKIDKFY